MPRIYDNIDQHLLEGLSESLKPACRADFCIGYFNLRGWQHLADTIEGLAGSKCIEKNQDGDSIEVPRTCRVLIGMHQPSEAEVLRRYLTRGQEKRMDDEEAHRLRRKIIEEFRHQLTLGLPNAKDNKCLRQLSAQLKSGKVAVKLHLRHRLHAKLYLAHWDNKAAPRHGFIGSSNLTHSGLKGQGELNTDVQDHSAAERLDEWFQARWNDKYSLDISLELAEVIDASWVYEKHPYHIYLKMAYHLSSEARQGLAEYRIPSGFEHLLEYQRQAVMIAAKKMDKRGGVLIGDVVGLGKTITACAIARMKEVEEGIGALIICPASLVSMWQQYKVAYDLKADIVSLGAVQQDLKEYHDIRERIVIIDESHNLRNSGGSRYSAIKAFLDTNERHRIILLSATPYNKTYLDLANQLRLFIPDDRDLGISPTEHIREVGEGEFALEIGDFLPRSIRAFEFSDHPDDWKELMRMYMVRRTRSFIKDTYAETDEASGRKYLQLQGQERFYFPERVPKRAEFPFDPADTTDQYARLYSVPVVDAINDLQLPRYGLALYLDEAAKKSATGADRQALDNLSRAGKRLMGFCRTNLFKRLESSGWAFMLSLSRHILRNATFLYALDNGLPLPIGKSYSPISDDYLEDQDPDDEGVRTLLTDEKAYKEAAEHAYAAYEADHKKYHWLDPRYFTSSLKRHLKADMKLLRGILSSAGSWHPQEDRKLQALIRLLTKKHPEEKILVFTQFADTAHYLGDELQRLGISQLEVATGGSDNVIALARRFSPNSNGIATDFPIRVLVATDVLSEGQNLQDSHIIINYDLPWAIIRLIQRAGRVDRIGQKATEVLCYSFLPEDGIENIITLRGRLRQRIGENAEVVGSDEVFFEDDRVNLAALYTERSGILDGDEESEGEVDLASYALKIWKDATKDDAALAKTVQDLPDVVRAAQKADKERPLESAIVYCRTAAENDTLAWLKKDGSIVSTGQMAILKAASCTPETKPLSIPASHDETERVAIEHIHAEERSSGASLGNKRSVRYRVYHRLKPYCDKQAGTLFAPKSLSLAIDAILNNPGLKPAARELLHRHLRVDAMNDDALATLVITLYESGDLVPDEHDGETDKEGYTQIICSMGFA